MIFPSNRLLGLAALLLAAGAFLAVLAGGTPLVFMACLLILLLAAGWDAMRAYGYRESVTITTPETIRLTAEAEGVIPFTLKTAEKPIKQVRFASNWPEELGLEEKIYALRNLKPEQQTLVEWTCCPKRRGGWKLEKAYLILLSPWGLWQYRIAQKLQTDIRAYPNLTGMAKHAAIAFLNRGNYGNKSQRKMGKGREFEMLRDYSPGDQYEDIHWRATARHNKPITKVFQIERTQEVYVIMDHSRMSGRPVQQPNPSPKTTQRTMLDQCILSALLLHQVAHQQGDRFGLLTYHERISHFVRAQSGKAHYRSCADALYDLQPSDTAPALEEVFRFIRLHLRKRALLIFLTSLDDPVYAETLSKHIHIISRKHLVYINNVAPSPPLPLFHTAPVKDENALYQRMGSHLVWRQLQEIKQDLSHTGVHMETATPDRVITDILNQYMEVKARQLL